MTLKNANTNAFIFSHLTILLFENVLFYAKKRLERRFFDDSEQLLLAVAEGGFAQMAVGEFRSFTATGGALDEALLDEVGFVNVLYRTGIFAHGRSDGIEAHGSAAELIDDGEQQLVINLVETEGVDIEGLQGILSDIEVDTAVTLDLGEVAHTTQQGVGDTRRTTTAAGYLAGSFLVDLHTQQTCRAAHDPRKDIGIVVLKMAVDTKAGTERRGKQTGARSSADKREAIEVDLDSTRRRALVDHDVDTIVLHRGIEVLLHHGRETMNLVDEEHIVGFERGEQTGQVARLVEHGAGSDLEAHAQFIGDNVAQRGLAQTRRAEEQDVVKRLAAELSGLHEDLEVGGHLALTGKVGKAQRTQGVVLLTFGLSISNVKFCHNNLSSWTSGTSFTSRTSFLVEQLFQVGDLVYHLVGFYLSVVEDHDTVAHLAHLLHDMRR